MVIQNKNEGELLSLHPPLEPLKTGRLAVSNGHELFFERSGNPRGEPLLFLHGGPGSGSSPDQRRLFDPEHFQIIQFDQRGCGQSTPHGSLTNNTTGHLVQDIKSLLDHLELEKIHLAGGSWGSTLALSFGVEFPERLHSLLLYGIFLCRPRELQALYFPGGIAQQIYPDLFEDYLALLTEPERQNPIEGYRTLFHSHNDAKRNEALLMWTRLEKQLSRVLVDQNTLETELANPDFVLSHSLIENHYFQHHGFMDGDELLANAAQKLQSIPIHLINGRYDLVCPVITAYEVHKALPHSTLTIVPDAGHSFREPGMTDAIIRAGEDIWRTKPR